MKKTRSILEFLSMAKKTSIEKETVEKPIARERREKKEEILIKLWELTGRVAIIAEKPKAARKIVSALSRDYIRKTLYGIPYYMINRGRQQVIYIVSAAGHLYGLHTDQRGYPVFNYTWKPLYEIEKNAQHTEKFIKLIDKICKESDYYINACDYDIEGSVIGYMIILFHGDPKRSYRVKYSSLTPEELREAFNRITSLDWEMIEAGLCRHELDYIWGINTSRALMDAVRIASGKRVILSAGRVQTPTLRYVVERDIERNLFIPIPQYTLTIYIEKNGQQIRLEYHGENIESKREARLIAEKIKETGYLVVKRFEERKINLYPPPPFNLGDLQEEAARIYGFSPYKTQSIAEKLYLDALISYPRTNSQKLPKTLNYRKILDKLSYINNYGVLVRQLLIETKGILKPVEGKKEDPAHPAIYPTGVKPGDLRQDEWKIYDLIVRRFLAVFSKPAVLARRSVILYSPGINNIWFQATGQKIMYHGWLRYYPFTMPEEKPLPIFHTGEKVRVVKVSIRKTYTRPPEKLSRIKILRWMENTGIGTEATRARIIEILFKRGYLESKGGGTVSSDLGMGVIEVLMEYFPEITSVELTRYFEQQMEYIREGRISRREVVNEAKATLLKLLREFDRNKYRIGLTLSYRLGFLSPKNKCRICNREAYREGLCRYHYEALEKIKKTYEEWERREEISWDEYIKAIKKLKSTGKWVKEVLQAGITSSV